MTWNFDLSQAPRGIISHRTQMLGVNEITVEVFTPENILAAGSDEVVTISRWLPKAERWCMFTKENPPLAWMEMPKHPDTALK